MTQDNIGLGHLFDSRLISKEDTFSHRHSEITPACPFPAILISSRTIEENDGKAVHRVELDAFKAVDSAASMRVSLLCPQAGSTVRIR